MAETPSGAFALPQYLLRRMVAMSPTFQAAVGASTWGEALEKVFLKDAEGDEALPVACVFTQDQSWALQYGGSQNHLRPKGQLFLYLAQDVREQDYDDVNAAAIRFGNFLKTVDEVAGMSGQDQTSDTTFPDSHLSILNISLIATAETPRDMWPEYRFYWAAYAVDWGDGD